MLGPTVGVDLIRTNSCWKPVGISLRNKSPIGMLPSSGVERILSQRSSTVKGFKLPETPWEGVARDDLRASCKFLASVWSVSVLRDLLPSLTGPRGCLIGSRGGGGGRKIYKWHEYLVPRCESYISSTHLSNANVTQVRLLLDSRELF